MTMADPVITADPASETPVAEQGSTPRFWRDWGVDAWFADEAGADASKRIDGKGESHSDAAEAVAVGKLKLNRYQMNMLRDFKPLENLAYIGGTIRTYNGQDICDEAGFPSSDTTVEDARDQDVTLVRMELQNPSPNAGPPLQQDPGSPGINAPKFARRKLATWVHLALNEEFGGQEHGPYTIFKPDSFAAPSAKITLLFGVGGDLNRHGVRHYFDGSTDRIIVNVPGTEGYESSHARLVRGDPFRGKHWAVGITRAQIERLLERAGVTTPWEIDIVAAFSTGYRGLYATIMNTLLPDEEMVNPTTTTATVDGEIATATDYTPAVPPGTMLGTKLANVKRLVIFDCLYRDDTVKVGAPNTLIDVLTRLTKLASSRSASDPIEFIYYEATTAGSTDTFRPFGSNFAKLGVTDEVRATYRLDFRALRENPASPASPEGIAWLAVIMSRLLNEALNDHLIDPTFFNQKLDTAPYRGAKDVINGMITRIGTDDWKRGKITSAATPRAGQRSYRTFLEAAERTPFRNTMGLLLRDFITPFLLLGWGAWNLGEVAHDGLLVEFAWEGLVDIAGAVSPSPTAQTLSV